MANWTKQQLHIMRACADIYKEVPTIRFTTNNLAQRLDVSEASIYRHFPSKRKIISSLLEYCEISLLSAAKESMEDEELVGKDALNEVLELIGIYCDFFEDNPGIAAMVHNSSVSAELENFNDRVHVVFSDLQAAITILVNRSGQQDHAVCSKVGKEISASLEGHIQSWRRRGFNGSLNDDMFGSWQVISSWLATRPVAPA